MVSKEQAIKNYISLIKFLIEKYESVSKKVYELPCLNYKKDDFFKEKDPLKVLLQWNMFYRNDIDYFYKFKLNYDIEIIKEFIFKNKLDINIFQKDLDFMNDKLKNFKLSEENIININDLEILDIKNTVNKTLEVFDDFKNITYKTTEFKNKLDFSYKKRFYQFKIFENLAEDLIYNYPKLSYSNRIIAEINSFLSDFV
jgi:hypothetical protein